MNPTYILLPLLMRMFVLSVALVASQSDKSVENPTDSFITRSMIFNVVINDTVVLPCEINGFSTFPKVWRRGSTILTAGPMKISPQERLHLVRDHNLEIRNIQIQDAGDYVCQIPTLHPQELRHTVVILVSPRINRVSSAVEVNEGDIVTLQCEASGNPVPIIIWSRIGGLLNADSYSLNRFSITIERVTRREDGVYQCTASNGVGMAVTRNITLSVKYAPVIEVHRTWVQSGEGCDAHLVCTAHAKPSAHVMWYSGKTLLNTTEGYSKYSKHKLIIKDFHSSDFSIYICIAKNFLGSREMTYELSGLSTQAVFHSNPIGPYHDKFNLSWSVESCTIVEKFKLHYRISLGNDTYMVKHGDNHMVREWNGPKGSDEIFRRCGFGENQWKYVTLDVMRQEGLSKWGFFMFEGLQPGLIYEAKIQAFNHEGWSSPSSEFCFITYDVDPWDNFSMGTGRKYCRSLVLLIPLSFILETYLFNN